MSPTLSRSKQTAARTRWANYCKHAVCETALSSLGDFAWHRVISWWMALHRWKWKDVRRRFTGTSVPRHKCVTRSGLLLLLAASRCSHTKTL